MIKHFQFFKSRASRFNLEVKMVADDLVMVYSPKFFFDDWLIVEKEDHFELWHKTKSHSYNKTTYTRKDCRKHGLNGCSYHFQRKFHKKNRRKILRYIDEHNQYVAFYKKRNKINLVDRVLGTYKN